MRKTETATTHPIRSTALSFSRRAFMASPLASLRCAGLLSATFGLGSANVIRKESPGFTENDPLRYHLAIIAERNRLFRRLMQGKVPRVGIFWFTQEPSKPPVILGSGVPVELGKAYGIYVDGHHDHESHWKSIKPLLSPFFQEFGPKNWPRGRVLYNTALKQFEVDLSDQLNAPQFREKILDFFRLPEAFTAFSYDPHWARTCFTFGPNGPRELDV